MTRNPSKLFAERFSWKPKRNRTSSAHRRAERIRRHTPVERLDPDIGVSMVPGSRAQPTGNSAIYRKPHGSSVHRLSSCGALTRDSAPWTTRLPRRISRKACAVPGVLIVSIRWSVSVSGSIPAEKCHVKSYLRFVSPVLPFVSNVPCARREIETRILGISMLVTRSNRCQGSQM